MQNAEAEEESHNEFSNETEKSKTCTRMDNLKLDINSGSSDTDKYDLAVI